MTQPQSSSNSAEQKDALAEEHTGYAVGMGIGGTNLRLALDTASYIQ
jgi:hypothetical protein